MGIVHSDFFDSVSADELCAINGGGILTAIAVGIGAVALIALTIVAAPAVTVGLVLGVAAECILGTAGVIAAL